MFPALLYLTVLYFYRLQLPPDHNHRKVASASSIASTSSIPMKRMPTVNRRVPNKQRLSGFVVITTIILISVAVCVWYMTAKRGDVFLKYIL